MKSPRAQWRSESGPLYNAYVFCYSRVYKIVMQMTHHFDFHRMKRIDMDDGVTLHWCHWCGLRAKEMPSFRHDSLGGGSAEFGMQDVTEENPKT